MKLTRKMILPLLLVLALLLGCGHQSQQNPQETQGQQSGGTDHPGETTPTAPAEPTLSHNDPFSDRDFEKDYDAGDCTTITLSGSTATWDGAGVKLQGSSVTITEEGTYVLTGNFLGTVVVDMDKEEKAQLVLSNAHVTAENAAPLHIVQGDKVFLTLPAGTDNSLTAGESFGEDDSVDGAIFSKEDLTINGDGKLTLTSPAGHGIVSKDELTLTGGELHITAAGHGLSGKDSVCIAGGSITAQTGKDGIHSENNDDDTLGFVYISGGSFTLTTAGDGISAQSKLEIHGGTYAITAGGGSANTAAQSGGFGGFGGGMPPTGGFGETGSQPPMPTGEAGMTPPEGGSAPPAPPQGGTAPPEGTPPDGYGGGMTPPDGAGGFQGFGEGGLENTEASLEQTEETASTKGVKSGGSLVILDGSFVIDSADDAIHSNGNGAISGGSFTLSTGDDGIHAEERLEVSGGNVTITASYEGLEALYLTISGGEITLTATDDGLNAAGGMDQSGTGGRDGFFGGGRGGGTSQGSITITGGSIRIFAMGDGIDANGSLTIEGGDITVFCPNRGDTAVLDYDASAVISGGTFLGTGMAGGMAKGFSQSTQAVYAVTTGSQRAGTTLAVSDAQGKLLVELSPPMDYGLLIFSSPDLVKEESYTLTIGTQTGTFQAK